MIKFTALKWEKVHLRDMSHPRMKAKHVLKTLKNADKSDLTYVNHDADVGSAVVPVDGSQLMIFIKVVHLKITHIGVRALY